MAKRRVQEEETPLYADVDLERQVLKHIVTRDHRLALNVDADAFKCRTHRTIFRAALATRSTYPGKAAHAAIKRNASGIDAQSDYSTLDEDIDSVLRAPELSSGAAWEALASLKSIHVQGQIVSAAEGAGELARNGQIDEAVKVIQTVLASDRRRIDSGDYLADFDARQAVLKEREAQRKSGVSDLIPTGLSKYDELTGGLMRGELGVLIGPTGGGKSAAKLNFAIYAWLRGYNVVHVGLEMSREENEFRADALIAQIPFAHFRLASMSTMDRKRWNAGIKLLREQRQNYLEFVGMHLPTLPEVLAFTESVSARRGPVDLLVLDHITLVQRDWPRERHEKLFALAYELSAWAKQRKVAVWTSGQLDSDGQKSRGKPESMRAENFKYGKGVAEAAPIVAGILDSEQTSATGELLFIPLKGRNVKKGARFSLLPDFDRMILDRVSYATGIVNELHMQINKLVGGKAK